MHRFSTLDQQHHRRESLEKELLIASEPTPISSSEAEPLPKAIVGVKAEGPTSDMELTIDTSTEDGLPLGSGTSMPVNSPTVSETTTVPGDNLLSLKWNGFQHHIVDNLVTLFRTEELADVTLVADNGEPVKAHKIILALSSPYFRKLFQDNPCKHPIVVLQGVRHDELVQVMNFIYKGQVRVCENEFDDFMEAAESLRIDGINAHPSNASDATEGSPSTQSPERGGSSPNDESRQSDWQGFGVGHGQSQRAFTAPPDEVAATSPVGPSVSFRKRSSVSSGISSDTVGSLNEQRGLSAPSSPTTTPLNLQQQALVENSIIAGMKPSLSDSGPTPPVLIEIDEDEDPKWEFPRSNVARNHQQALRDLQREHNLQASRIERRKRQNLERNNRRSSLMAEDLSKSSNARRRSPDYDARNSSTFRTGAGVPGLSYEQEKRSTSWPLESRPQARNPSALVSTIFSQMTSKGHLLPGVAPRYFPFLPTSTSLPRPIAHHPLHFPSSTVTQASSNVPFGFPSQRRARSPSYVNEGSQDSRLKRQREVSPSSPRSELFGHGSAAHFLAKYGMSPGNPTTALKFTKPKTKAIRSSQVPPSARYTASQVDSMVEKVENFPGPLVPCIVCQKFVKRERLRAHIHECHLLPEEKIECPICKIGLKSKGSFRVHLWRHRRSKSATEAKAKEATPTTTSI